MEISPVIRKTRKISEPTPSPPEFRGEEKRRFDEKIVEMRGRKLRWNFGYTSLPL
jgi:hypothetical protein